MTSKITQIKIENNAFQITTQPIFKKSYVSKKCSRNLINYAGTFKLISCTFMLKLFKLARKIIQKNEIQWKHSNRLNHLQKYKENNFNVFN